MEQKVANSMTDLGKEIDTLAEQLAALGPQISEFDIDKMLMEAAASSSNM